MSAPSKRMVPNVRRHQPGEHLHRRRFARAVRPEIAEHFARTHDEADVTHRRNGSVSFRDAPNLEHAGIRHQIRRFGTGPQPRTDRYNQGMAKSVAVIGASGSRQKYGNKALRAFAQQGFTVYAINPNEKVVEGYPTFASVLDVPGTIDMATDVCPA